MTKTSELIKNTGILAVGNFASKVLVFLLVPLYTAVLSTGEYGSYDIIYSSISLLIPILTLNIADAMLRFPLEKGADLAHIAHIGIGITLFSGVLVLACQLIPGMPWNNIAGSNYIAVFYISTAMYQLLSLLARGSERMVDVAVAGVISTLAIVILNILLLVVYKCGLDGFFIANISGMIVPVAYLTIRLRKIIFASSSSQDRGLLSKMVKYSLPLSAAVIGWWFISTSGRFIVTVVCGMDANGLYSIAFKIPSILSVVAGIFLQAWQISAVKEFDASDSDGFLLKTFDAVEMVLVLLCSVLILLSPYLAQLLYSGEFYSAWIYTPFLLVLATLNTMSGMWSPFFSAKYDTAPIAISTVIGGVINILMGIPLTMIFGIWGIVIANVLAGVLNWLYRGIKVKKHISINFHLLQSFLLCVVLCCQGVILTLDCLTLNMRVICAGFITVFLIIYYRKSIKQGLLLAMNAVAAKL
ncbi:oligosaccharide flippase family protein [Adlercreutzia sp. ZJ304]|uniref:lipopolysaccharide biosynthesis protein n=1 Tax=Adlercreutzia sp. ZJ304 TaxID=2709791 RepID=UPI0013EC10F4|nr:oligosaccharide flippase family protein [Adlercreutzia sp. ZJ304]